MIHEQLGGAFTAEPVHDQTFELLVLDSIFLQGKIAVRIAYKRDIFEINGIQNFISEGPANRFDVESVRFADKNALKDPYSEHGKRSLILT